MGREIERKFHVVGDEWRALATSRHRLVDAVSPFGEGKVRLRISDTRAWITFKGPRQGYTRAEFEYEIPEADARQILAAVEHRSLVVKTRFSVPLGEVVWSVDVHESPRAGLITAEVELQHDEQEVGLPTWVGAEITGAAARGVEPS